MEISSSTASFYQQDPRNQAGAIDTQHEGLKADVPGTTGGTITSRSVDASNNAEKASDGVSRGEQGDRVSNARAGSSEEADRSDGEKKAGENTEMRNGKELSLEEAQMVDELVARDREVRTHEQAHAAAGGQYAGAPTYSFQRGPDGQQYAVGGEVKIDTSPIPGDPAATMEKMRTVVAAANAPAEPSGQDRKVAAQATAAISEASAELVKMKEEERLEASEKAAEANRERQPGVDGEGEGAQGTEAAGRSDATPESARSPESRAAESDDPELTQSFASRTEAQSSMDRRLAGTGAVDGTEQGQVINNLI